LNNNDFIEKCVKRFFIGTFKIYQKVNVQFNDKFKSFLLKPKKPKNYATWLFLNPFVGREEGELSKPNSIQICFHTNEQNNGVAHCNFQSA